MGIVEKRMLTAVCVVAVVAAACGAGRGQAVRTGPGVSPSTTAVPAPEPGQQPAPEQQPPAPLEPFGTWHALDAGPLVTRGEPTAVWTGTDVIVVGGLLIDRYQVVVDGAAYRPSTRQWRTIASRPDPGRIFAGVWTGQEMIVWGGKGTAIVPEDPLSNGDAYDPSTNQWTPIAPNPMQFPAVPPTVVWTGSRVLLWPGMIGSPATATVGALYDPAANAWTTIPPANLPGVLSVGRGTWTGKVWAAPTLASTGSGGPAVPSLALFDPAINGWKAAPTPPISPDGPTPRLAWTGHEVLVMGDSVAVAYNPATNKWRRVRGPDLSMFPGIFRTVSLDDGRVVALVGNRSTYLDVYDPRTDTWTPTGPPPGPLPDPSDAGFTSTGNGAFVFGITTNGSIVLAAAPNAAWTWSP